jgi:hypothetical protein
MCARSELLNFLEKKMVIGIGTVLSSSPTVRLSIVRA